MRANGASEEEVKELQELFRFMNLPACLRDLAFPDSPDDLQHLCQLPLNCTNLSEEAQNAVIKAVTDSLF